MSWKIGMPNLGHTMEEGKVSEWLKKVGDSVTEGEVVAVVESDKASFDVESPVDGVLLSIEAASGETVAVGSTIGVVGAAGEFPAQAVPGISDAASQAHLVQQRERRVSPESVRQNASGGGAVSPTRRAIAAATARSWREIPHVPVTMRADITVLCETKSVPLTAVIGRAACLALGEHPSFNGWYSDDQFTPSPRVNLAIAVATSEGVITAVVPAAEGYGVRQLEGEIQGLAEKARRGKLEGSRMIGGSFTISSLGRWGVDSFAPIISTPQVAILGVGRIDSVVRRATDGGFAVRKELGLTLVFDHRANDGIEAAQLLASIRAYLQDADRLGPL